MFNWKLWGKGLLAAAIGGVTTSLTSSLADPGMLRNPQGLATVAGVGAALGGLSYLKTHPPVLVEPDPPQP
jgi:hypothetical protein